MRPDNSTLPDHEPRAGTKPPRLLGDLTRRVLGWMLLVSLLPLFVMAYQGYHCAAQALMEQTVDHLDSVLAARRSLIDAWLHCRRFEIQLLASNLQQDADRGLGIPSESLRRLEAGWARAHGYSWIALFDAEGRLTAVSGRTDLSVKTLPLPARTAASEAGAAAVYAPQEADALGRELWIVEGFGTPPASIQGWIAGRLDVREGLDALLRERNGLGNGGRIYVVLENLDILSDPLAPASGEGKADPSILQLVEGHHHAAHGLLHLGLNIPTVLRSAAAMPEEGWILVAEADPREALGWLGTLRTRAIVTGLVTLVVLVLVATWVARGLGRPLRELARVAHRVRSGRVNERLGSMAGVEAEEVRHAFNQMLDELREQQHELVKSTTLASMGELSSSIVHEMRNPLSSIKMNLQALRRQVDGDPVYRELATIASEQVRRVETMLDELLKFGRPVEMHPEVTRFRELAEAALSVVGDGAKVKRVEIDVEDGLNGHRIYVDREQMCRALTNLLSNAIQAVPAEGRVRLLGRAEEETKEIVIEVKDWGPGLPNEGEERLFKPFFTTKPDGTGLGLANVRKIVQLHDGRVAARNRPEGGASFTITLPLLDS